MIRLPLWLVLGLCLLAAWAFFEHLAFPAIRRLLRHRLDSLIKEIDKRLTIQLPAFKLAKRRKIIDRLMLDEQVLKAVKRYCQDTGVSRQKAMREAELYAREIVPSFNAYLYFRLGNWLSRVLVKSLYRVRVGFADEEALSKVEPNSSVVFIMNHRSNMDYIMLAYLALNRVALSFAVGEWARVWPIQQLIRSLGGFFIRRNSQNLLYRKVLASYVQISTAAGVVQAIYPEGRLSRDGRLSEPKIGLLDYMLRGFDLNKENDLVFIPVGINYDRVLEDRTLLLSTQEGKGRKNSILFVLKTTAAFALHNLWLKISGGWYRFGYAVVNFGTPVSMREYVKKHNHDFQQLAREARIEKIKHLAQDLMRSVGRVIPVTPVSLIATVFSKDSETTYSELEIKAQVQALIQRLEENRAYIYVPRGDWDYTLKVGLRMLTLRHFVLKKANLYRASPEEKIILGYYANTISHLF